MTTKGKLQSVRRTIVRLEVLNEKFIRDDLTGHCEREIRKLKDIEELLEKQIQKEDLDRLDRRKKTQPGS